MARGTLRTHVQSFQNPRRGDAWPRFSRLFSAMSRDLCRFTPSFPSFFFLSSSPLRFSKQDTRPTLKHRSPRCKSFDCPRVTLLRMIHARARVALYSPRLLLSNRLSSPSLLSWPSPIQRFFSFSPVLSLPLYSSPSFCLSRTSTIHGAATSMDGRGLALRDRCDLFDCIEGA